MRRHVHRWAVWLMPLLVVRLFVPTGFMLSASGAGLGLALCPSYAPLPTPATATIAEHHAGMDHGANAPQGSEQQGSGKQICPLVLVGSTASCPATPLIGELPRIAQAVSRFHLHPAWVSPAVLIDRIRGPPLA